MFFEDKKKKKLIPILMSSVFVLQDACRTLRERLEPLKKDNPNLTWPQLVGFAMFISLFVSLSKRYWLVKRIEKGG